MEIDRSYREKYYKEHKARILQQMAAPRHCPVCNKGVQHAYWQKHIRTERHKRLSKFVDDEAAKRFSVSWANLLLEFIMASETN